jgi:hydrogenase-4 component B
VLIGLAPALLAPVLDRVVAAWDPALPVPHANLATLVPLAAVGLAGLCFSAVVAGLWAGLLRMLRARGIERAGTWDCGYARPTARMQYTASSFAGSLVRLFGWVLRPRTHRPEIQGIWPAPSSFESHIDDLVLDRRILPAAGAIERWLARFRLLQQGLTQHYVLYILLTVIALLLWAMPLEQLLAQLWGR